MARLTAGLICAFLCFIGQLVHAQTLYRFDTVAQEQHFHQLLRELRCLVCQNQDLEDSNAPLAQDLRHQVYQLLQKGRSGQDIKTYLSTRYGDFILFKPQLKSSTMVLYFGPIFFLLLGLIILWRVCF